jgi:hypothetical protein
LHKQNENHNQYGGHTLEPAHIPLSKPFEDPCEMKVTVYFHVVYDSSSIRASNLALVRVLFLRLERD